MRNSNARLRCQYIAHEGFLVQLGVSVKLQTAFVHIILDIFALILNVVDVISHFLDNKKWTAPTKLKLLTFTRFRARNKDVLTNVEVGHLPTRTSVLAALTYFLQVFQYPWVQL